MTTDLTVIVPVYNAEKFLYDSLGNLVNQTFRKRHTMEVLLINDASTDNSLSILTQCAAQYPELVRVIDLTKNHGAGGARNFGLNEAKGTYIGFLDADDMLDTTMYEKLWDAAHKDGTEADFADCGVMVEKNNEATLFTAPELFGVLDDEKRARLIALPGFMVTRIFRRALIEELHLRFRERFIMEDNDFLIRFFAAAKDCAGVMEILYKYRDNPDSFSARGDEDFMQASTDAVNAIYDALSVLDHYEGIRLGAEFAMLHIIVRALNGLDIFERAGRIDKKTKRQTEYELKRLKNRVCKTKPAENHFVDDIFGDEMRERLLRLG